MFYSLIYISVYVILFLIVSFLNKIYYNNNLKFLYTSGIMLSLFASLSYDVGWDYVVYMDMIKDKMDCSRIEVLEQWLIIYSRHIGFPQLFFIVNHTAIVMLNIFAIKKSSINPYLSVIIFLCMPLAFLLGISTIRAALAASVIFFAYEYFLKEKKVICFIAAVLFSFFIHSSSIIGLFMIAVFYVKISLSVNIIFFIISAVSSLQLLQIIPYMQLFSFLDSSVDRFDFYAENGENTTSNIPLLYYAINIINFILYKVYGEKNSDLKKYITLFNLGCCVSLLFSFNHTLCLRLSRYFYGFLVLIIPFYNVGFAKFTNRNILTRLIVISCFLLFVYQLILPNYNGSDHTRISTYWPYQLFFLID